MFNKEIANFHLKEHQSFIDYISKDEVSGSYLLIVQNSIGKKDFAFGISEIIDLLFVSNLQMDDSIQIL